VYFIKNVSILVYDVLLLTVLIPYIITERHCRRRRRMGDQSSTGHTRRGRICFCVTHFIIFISHSARRSKRHNSLRAIQCDNYMRFYTAIPSARSLRHNGATECR
jgi:hypothetical protein